MSDTAPPPSGKQGKSRRGFASMSPEKRREAARKGAARARELGVAHEFTSEEAREAGKKGGAARAARRNKSKKQKEKAA